MTDDQGNGDRDKGAFEDMLGRLEEVVEALEGGGLALEESLKLFEEGIKLSRLAAGRIDAAERRIEELLADGTVVPFADGVHTAEVAVEGEAR